MIELPDAPFTLASFLALAATGKQVALSAAHRDTIARARAVVDRYAAGDAPVYGLNTGLGGNVGYRLKPEEVAGFQEQVIRGRCIGAGPPLDPATCRAALLARIVGAAKGGPGLSPAVVDAMVALFNAGVTPVIPARGSIGAGDLALCAHLVAPLDRAGAGVVRRALPARGRCAGSGGAASRYAGAEGRAGADQLQRGQHRAWRPRAARQLADLLTIATAAVTALSYEGYWANPGVLDPRLAAARPAGRPGCSRRTGCGRLLAGQHRRSRRCRTAYASAPPPRSWAWC